MQRDTNEEPQCVVCKAPARVFLQGSYQEMKENGRYERTIYGQALGYCFAHAPDSAPITDISSWKGG